jgi:WD40 repeat protein
MNNAFISYSRRDREFVEKLVAAFNSQGRDVWVDWEDIPLTADWLEEIYQGIEGADDFIFIISPDSINSEVCTQELNHALKHHKRLVPVLHRDIKDYREVHKSLSSHNWIIFTNPDDFDKSFTALLKALDTDLEYTRSHTRLLQRALEWEKRNHNASLLLRGTDLTEAEHWLGSAGNRVPNVTPLQTEYILTSRKRANRFQRFMIGTLGMGFVASMLLTLVAINNGNEAQIARNAAQTQAAIATAAQGEALISADLAAERAADVQSLLLADNAAQTLDENPELAIVLALEANRIDSPPAQSQRILADIAYAPGIKRVFQGFRGAVNAVAFSGDRNHAVSASYDGTIALWDINSGARLFAINEQALPVKSVAYSPDSRFIAAGLLDGRVLVIDARTGEVRHRLGGIRAQKGHTARVNAVVFTADSRSLLSAGSDDVIILWDLQTGEEVHRFSGHNGDVSVLALSADGKQIYSGSEDKRIIVWELERRRPVNQFLLHASSVTGLALSPDGLYGVSSSENNELYVWNAMSGEIKWRLGDAFGTFKINQAVSGVNFTPDSRRVISVSLDGRLLVWDIEAGKGLSSLKSGGNPLLSVAVARDGRSILTGSSGQSNSVMLLWDIDTGAVMGYLEGHNDGINTVAYSPDSAYIATGSDDWDVIVWDAKDFEIVHRLSGHSDDVNTIAYNTTGSLLASGSEDGSIIIWNTTDGSEKIRLDVAPARVNTLVFLPNTDQVLAGLDDSHLVLFDVETGEIVRVFEGHDRRVLSVAVSPSGEYVISGSAGGELLLWNLGDATVNKRFIGHMGRVLSLAFSPDSKWVLSGSDNGRILLWDITSSEIRLQFETNAAAVWSLQFSANGLYALSGSADNAVKLWDVATGEVIRLFDTTHTAPVLGVAFSPDNQYAVSGSRDMLGVVWRMPSPQGLMEWVKDNRYIVDLRCDQKLLYRIVQSCPSDALTTPSAQEVIDRKR